MTEAPHTYVRGVSSGASSERKSAEAENVYPSNGLTSVEFREGGLKYLSLYSKVVPLDTFADTV